ncbi:lipoate--protein ligase [Acetobacterium paludosum]|uniref:Lipoate--protein ligase n=1 Tax=Acetobacterium paludosum TaxID=52693 RepID=A0A923HYX4_9FIRM|nr:lipoate--protein ligase [Acetobacterium paludosum]MBC3887113.1 lipoate--protein ligase [Acetobacterium paludosum]
MKYVNSKNNNVNYNLAVEEYIFSNMMDDDFLLLWVNDPCVVIGKHQNIFEEVNCKEIQKNGVTVARRNSGGGTVFQDKGNLNFTLITDYNPDNFSGYDEFLSPIIKILNEMGIPAEKRNVCDIAIGDKKISGNAQSIKKNRVLHHGTLLFDADLDALRTQLKPVNGEFKSKAVKSIRSSVTNIIDHLADKNLDFEGFKEVILNSLCSNEIDEVKLSAADIEKIRALEKSKYVTWNWIYGFSPTFIFKKRGDFKDHQFDLYLVVEKGKIKESKFKSITLPVEKIESLLSGHRYDYFVLTDLFSGIKDLEDFADCLF